MNSLIKIKILAVLMCLFTTSGCTTFAKTTKPSRKIHLEGRNTIVYAQGVSIYEYDLVLHALMAKRLMLPEEETLYLVISSPGGYYHVARGMMFALNRLPNIALVCLNCHSAAGLIFMTSPHPRLVVEKSKLMMHEMYNAHATAKFMNNEDNRTDFSRSSDEFDNLIATALKMDVEAYRVKVTNKSWTLQGKDIVKNHLADEVVTVGCDDYVKSIAPVTCGMPEE